MTRPTADPITLPEGMSAILPGIVDEARRLLDVAAGEDATISLLGGVAIRLHSDVVPAPLDREYKDLDFVVPKGRGRDADKLLSESGYQPEASFNAMNGNERMLFHDLDHGRQVDVFVGSFRMCHVIPLSERLAPGQPTVPLAELLLTKLQIVELNEKDVRDTVLLFHNHEVADHDEDAVNAARIAELCAGDWGLWRTITHNLAQCDELLARYALAEDDRRRVSARIGTVLERIEKAPKSRGWKLRARIGERKRWYDLPEEVDR
jgi:putative nucleotidyltransferase-like protein